MCLYVYGDCVGFLIKSNTTYIHHIHNHTQQPPQRSLNTQDHPYTVATAEAGYEDLPLVQRLVPECDSLEAKIEYLVREILAYCIRWYVGVWVGVYIVGGVCIYSISPSFLSIFDPSFLCKASLMNINRRTHQPPGHTLKTGSARRWRRSA